MIRIFIIYILFYNCFTFSQQTTIHKYSIKKSTLNSIGSSNVYLKSKKISVLQSVGQSGIIGTKEIKSAIVQQGFLNSTLFLKVNNSNNNFIKEVLKFVINPNPFIDYIKIDFSKKTLFEVYIRVSDVNGKTFITRNFEPTDKITLPLNRLSIGTYLIHIKSGNNSSTEKILKIE